MTTILTQNVFNSDLSYKSSFFNLYFQTVIAKILINDDS